MMLCWTNYPASNHEDKWHWGNTYMLPIIYSAHRHSASCNLNEGKKKIAHSWRWKKLFTFITFLWYVSSLLCFYKLFYIDELFQFAFSATVQKSVQEKAKFVYLIFNLILKNSFKREVNAHGKRNPQEK